MTRYRAVVREIRGTARHVLLTPEGTAPIEDPVRLEIEDGTDGCFLYRLNAVGDCVADTWHATLAEAMRQAQVEYSVNPDDWDVERQSDSR